MNENIDLTKILKHCPEGTKLYSTIYGEVEFDRIKEGDAYSIIFTTESGSEGTVTSDGKHYNYFDGDCTLFPSKDQRDWSKFKVNKFKFNPNTLQPFDKIIARIDKYGFWRCELFSFIEEGTNLIKGCGAYYKYCVPYNNDTKHLIGTADEAPEYYKYWED